MEVFTDGWISQIRKKHEQRQGLRTYLYLLATKDEYQTTRAEIENWINGLPEIIRSKLISRLRSSKNHIQTYNELAIGSVLKQLGYQLEYEKPLSGHTPDWYVHPKGDIPAFIVEVFTANPSNEWTAQRRQKIDLVKRLEQIPIDVTMNIRFRGNMALDQHQNKIIATKIRKWLEDDNPPVGTQISLTGTGIIFKITYRGRGFPHVTLAFFDISRVNSKSLRWKIKDKIDNYKDLLQEVRIPYVISIVPNPLTGLEQDNFIDVLFGQGIINITLEEAIGTIGGQRSERNSDGVFLISPSLSAAIWVWKSQRDWNFRAAYNPNATYPLPLDTFVL